eukprot:226608-Hanusia_phi.AAC.1
MPRLGIGDVRPRASSLERGAEDLIACPGTSSCRTSMKTSGWSCRGQRKPRGAGRCSASESAEGEEGMRQAGEGMGLEGSLIEPPGAEDC